MLPPRNLSTRATGFSIRPDLPLLHLYVASIPTKGAIWVLYASSPLARAIYRRFGAVLRALKRRISARS
jgi:hypothetical protein